MSTPTKNAIRREQFRKLGQALSSLERDWAIRRADFVYEIKPKAINDRDVSSRLYGPQMRSQQFEKTISIRRA